jgi:hypothetical protein
MYWAVLYVSHVIRTYYSCSYKLKQLASSDDVEPIPNILNSIAMHDTFASLYTKLEACTGSKPDLTS